MQEFPHHYEVIATAAADADVSVTGDRLEPIPTTAPVQFGGPGDKWSPETLLTAAVASCFILTFRAIARASNLPWNSLKCHVDGTLERKDGKTKFTQFVVHATLGIPQDASEERARRLLEKAEGSCLVTSSLACATRLEAVVSKS